MSEPSTMSRDALLASFETPFARILALLLRDVPLARGAALVDAEGEAVDAVGTLDPYDLRLAAAHCQILHREAQVALGPIMGSEDFTFRFRAGRAGYLIYPLQEGYLLTLLTHPRAVFAIPDICLSVAADAIALEAGWPVDTAGRWRRATVVVGCAMGSWPSALLEEGQELPCRVLSHGVPPTSLRAAARSFRVRTATDKDVELVRVPGGAWYQRELCSGPFETVDKPGEQN